MANLPAWCCRCRKRLERSGDGFVADGRSLLGRSSTVGKLPIYYQSKNRPVLRALLSIHTHTHTHTHTHMHAHFLLPLPFECLTISPSPSPSPSLSLSPIHLPMLIIINNKVSLHLSDPTCPHPVLIYQMSATTVPQCHFTIGP